MLVATFSQFTYIGIDFAIAIDPHLQPRLLDEQLIAGLLAAGRKHALIARYSNREGWTAITGTASVWDIRISALRIPDHMGGEFFGKLDY